MTEMTLNELTLLEGFLRKEGRVTLGEEQGEYLFALARRALESQSRRTEADAKHAAMTVQQREDAMKRMIRFAFSDDDGEPDPDLLKRDHCRDCVEAKVRLTAAFERLLANHERRPIRAEGPSPSECETLTEKLLGNIESESRPQSQGVPTREPEPAEMVVMRFCGRHGESWSNSDLVALVEQERAAAYQAGLADRDQRCLQSDMQRIRERLAYEAGRRSALAHSEAE